MTFESTTELDFEVDAFEVPAVGEVAFKAPFKVPAAFVLRESAFEEAAAPGEKVPPFDEAGDTAAFEVPAFLVGVAGLDVLALEDPPALEEIAEEPRSAFEKLLVLAEELPPTTEELSVDTAEVVFEVPLLAMAEEEEALTEEEVVTTMLDTADAFEVFEPVEERVEAGPPPPAVEETNEPVLLQLVDSFRTDFPWPSLPAMLGAILIWFASPGLFAVD